MSDQAIELLVKGGEGQWDHLQSHACDELDLITSPRDGALVAVMERSGVHVCWMCAKMFVEEDGNPLRPLEFNCGGQGTRILIHSNCAPKASKKIEQMGGRDAGVFWQAVFLHRARRAVTRMTKPFRKQ